MAPLSSLGEAATAGGFVVFIACVYHAVEWFRRLHLELDALLLCTLAIHCEMKGPTCEQSTLGVPMIELPLDATVRLVDRETRSACKCAHSH